LTEENKIALIVGLQYPSANARESEESLAELEDLVRNIGLVPKAKIIVKMKTPTPRLLVGTGKADEILSRAKDAEAAVVVFDDELSPSQQRNWEELTGLAVIDRQEVILEIFADRATTREAQLQVELARMEYSLPRLTRAWTHLSRQKGGNKGARGEGETQLELDRRKVLNKIAKAKKELKKVRDQRKVRRAGRTKAEIPAGSIVGYTNAGKSSLLKALSGTDLYVENKLFATLDPTTRKIRLPGGGTALLTDTVGFIRKLPHQLIESFKATLEETVIADFLVIVMDSSDPDMEHHAATTREALREIGAGDKPVVTVFNKTDLAGDLSRFSNVHAYPNAVFLSAKTGEGIGSLLTKIDEVLSVEIVRHRYEIPGDRHDLVSLLHRKGRVIQEDYTDTGTTVTAQVTGKLKTLLAPYLVGETLPG
jgi:GTP-binding protein HflX